MSISESIGLLAIEKFLEHSKDCRECEKLYDEFLNRTMYNQKCFRKFFSDISGEKIE